VATRRLHGVIEYIKAIGAVVVGVTGVHRRILQVLAIWLCWAWERRAYQTPAASGVLIVGGGIGSISKLIIV
jgi:hypothetical protein